MLWYNIVLFGLLLCLNALDYLFTKKILENGGVEKNPVAAYIIEKGGVKLLGVAKLLSLFVLGGLVQIIPDPRMTLFLLLSLNAVYGYVVYRNRKVLEEML